MSKPLFIHIPKNAGTAINRSGLAVPVVYDYISDFHKKIEESSEIIHFSMYKHLPYSYINPNILRQFSKRFAVVRNPWSRVVSIYNYADKISSHPLYPKIYNKITFKQFLDRRNTWSINPFFYRQLPYDLWANQSLWQVGDAIDILRYENLNDDLSNYLEKDVELPIVNKGIYSDDYRYYYDEESYKAVFDWYKEDIDRWGFTFDSGATRNYWTNK